LGDVGCLETEGLPASAVADDAVLRRRLSSEIWRALADPVFARALLNDPVAVLGSTGYTLRQHRRLASIRATTVRDFARQAEPLFWPDINRDRYASGQLARAVGQ
jgi:hypothetical protein